MPARGSFLCCMQVAWQVLVYKEHKVMKNSLILLILIFGSMAYGQTDSIEKSIIYNKLLNKEIRQDEFSKIWISWNQTIKEIGKYPDLPLDRSGKAHYSFIFELQGVSKEKLFVRTLEWLSINYGLVPSYIYSNPEDGKIIFRANFNMITGNTCTYSSVISVKNEKLLIEFINIRYQIFIAGHYSNETWIPETTIDYGIDQVYPIILKKSSGWNSDLNLLKATNEFFNTEIGNLYDFITSYDDTYSF
jgi:hypothetical protein